MHYVLLAEHAPETCPTSNSTVREIMLKGAAQVPDMAKRLGVKIVAGPFANREHLLVTIVEAQKAEAVDDFIVESGISQWNKVRVLPSMTLEDGIKQMDRQKPIF
jgi:uncharacterized protein with GYD domain